MNITLKSAQQNAINWSAKKELINSRVVMGFADGKFIEIAVARWYMGRSATASTVYCSLWVWHGFEDCTSGTGKAGGGGYCKQSGAFYDALTSAGIDSEREVAGRGMSVVEDVLSDIAKNAGFVNFYVCRG